MITCVLCEEVKPDRKTGDHVLLQALGSFQPELLIKNICQVCDERNGRKLEKELATQGPTALRRWLLQLPNANRRGVKTYSPFHDPEVSRAMRMVCQNPKYPLLTAGKDGKLEYPDYIRVSSKKGEMYEVLDPRASPIVIADTIEGAIRGLGLCELQVSLGSKSKLSHLESILKVRQKRNNIFDPELARATVESIRVMVETEFTDKSIRAAAYGCLKLMILQGVQRGVWENLWALISRRTGINEPGAVRIVPWMTKIPQFDETTAGLCHKYSWGIARDGLTVSAEYFSSATMHMRILVHVPLGRFSGILVPSGSASFDLGTKRAQVMLGGDDITSQYDPILP